jgi:hypothetical protein
VTPSSAASRPATDWVASALVKSLAPPLPSVLPIEATISAGSITLSEISLRSSLTSPGLAMESR